MKTIVISRMYAGGYLNNNIGGEIINLLHDDFGNNYISTEPLGYIGEKYNDTVEAIVLTRLLKSGCFEILGIAKIGKDGQIVKVDNSLRKVDKFKLAEEQRQAYLESHKMQYAGVDNKTLGRPFTFKSEKLLLPKKTLYLTDEKRSKYIPAEDYAYNLKDKTFPDQSLLCYVTDKENPKAYAKIKQIIDNEKLWVWDTKDKTSIDKIIDRQDRQHFNYLNVIHKEDDELVYSNLFYYFFANHNNLLFKFGKEVLGVDLAGEVTIQRERANIDLWISDANNIIVIENKIKSGINGIVDCENKKDLIKSQLLKYYNYAEKERKKENNEGKATEKKAHYFVFVPNYNKIDLSKYSGGCHYKEIKYSKLFEFFDKQKVDDVYYKEFVKALYKHTKDRQHDYYEDMAHRFLQLIKRKNKKD
ncbi:MAG: PD-(D/E)XK nuclease family protein [Clostridia bacterium]|nr:PD-(D/E)XK nuclease family protein [Clostridia bacterium]